MKIKIHYLDGKRLKRSIQASARHLGTMQNMLNDINVFPVSDGDTGTNMAYTMRSIVDGTANCHDTSIGTMTNAIAESALIGARGNSGAILAQFFQGFAESTSGKIRLNTKSFANAARNAVEKAKNAISNPMEGTIITVMREWANHVSEYAHQKHDFVDLLKESLKKARESLADTPNKLLILKKANVVDAGAQGFVHILEGLVDFMENGKIAAANKGAQLTDKIRQFRLQKADPDIQYQFCTECLISGSDINTDLLKKRLLDCGDSLIIGGSKLRTKVHIHTNHPDQVIAIASEFGQLVQNKIEDIKQQNADITRNTPATSIALVADTTCDLPADFIAANQINFIPLIIQNGPKSYLDRKELQPKEFYQLLQTSKSKFTTSQPPATAFTDMYQNLLRTNEHIFHCIFPIN
jgi:uncharacterized protein